MSDTPRNDAPTPGKRRGVLDALFGWLQRGSPLSNPASTLAGTAAPHAPPERLGRYRIERTLGQGGMGVVYAARDERLERTVALKAMSLGQDETARKRFWREARAAASVNHPHVCQIYEIGEDNGDLFIAMELLEGESLAERLIRGPLNVAHAVPIGLEMLAALSALHARGIVHRDLKPSNVFLTPHGVKLLDFGVARLELEPEEGARTNLTPSGMVVGTPAYMAPELVAGQAEPRSDLFAVGAILFEMVSGRRAFDGRTPMEVMHAVLYEHPAALSGSPAVVAMDRVIHRAMAKQASQRPASAQVMADELRAVQGAEGENTSAVARALTRLVVLPFRILRPDPESDFLAFSLADAISTSLSSIGTLVVRSSAVAARYGGEPLDLKVLAAEADVDRVVSGTVLRSGDQVRATAQLIEAPAGTLLTSLTVQSSLDDLFRLQDDIARRVVEALSLPLATGLLSPNPDAPQNARAYELYLRGNEVGRSYDGLPMARELYQQALELDPGFAPAWARLGRCHRVIAKFIDGNAGGDAEAERAFRRALELSPRLAIAHKYYANLEADIGQPRRAMVRLLGEAARHGNDPELFAGLVHACRYCGLYEQSLAAHIEARRLDPNVPTSLEQTMLMLGDLERHLAMGAPATSGGADEEMRVITLGLAGRRDEARATLRALRAPPNIPAFNVWTAYLNAWLDRDVQAMRTGLDGLGPLTIQMDPEALFLEGWLLCEAGDPQGGLELLQRAVRKSYFVAPTLAQNRHFDALRGDPGFQALLAEAEAGREDALRAFREAGGERLLGR